jgi:hypothetical protein
MAQFPIMPIRAKLIGKDQLYEVDVLTASTKAIRPGAFFG